LPGVVVRCSFPCSDTNKINYCGNCGKKLQVSEKEIQELAYYKWKQANKPQGKDLYFWQEAKKELSCTCEKDIVFLN
jgi:hypothetical protein